MQLAYENLIRTTPPENLQQAYIQFQKDNPDIILPASLMAGPRGLNFRDHPPSVFTDRSEIPVMSLKPGDKVSDKTVTHTSGIVQTSDDTDRGTLVARIEKPDGSTQIVYADYHEAVQYRPPEAPKT